MKGGSFAITWPNQNAVRSGYMERFHDWTSFSEFQWPKEDLLMGLLPSCKWQHLGKIHKVFPDDEKISKLGWKRNHLYAKQ